jgi:hypothetical protein
MPHGNQHWVEELDFAIEEWTLNGARLVEVLGRVHLLDMAHQAFVAAAKAKEYAMSLDGAHSAGRSALQTRAWQAASTRRDKKYYPAPTPRAFLDFAQSPKI